MVINLICILDLLSQDTHKLLLAKPISVMMNIAESVRNSQDEPCARAPPPQPSLSPAIPVNLVENTSASDTSSSRSRENMTSISEIVRLADIYRLPEEVLELILRQIFSWGLPKVDDQGYVVARMKNIRKCPIDLVLENVVNRGRWQHIARLPYLHSYERRVCIWAPEYYDIRTDISGMSEWVKYPPHLSNQKYNIALPLSRISRRSEEWIGFKSWIQTHPAFTGNDFRSSGFGSATSSKMLSKHWFKYELILAYPSLYGKNGWAKKL
jgi:hypothetical protein